MSLKDISENQKRHWSELLQNNPDLVRAVGSESETHKKLRYAKLCELFGGGTSPSMILAQVSAVSMDISKIV